MHDSRKYGYKRLETDDELRARCLAAWVKRTGSATGNYATSLVDATSERLDKLAWELKLQRKIIDVY